MRVCTLFLVAATIASVSCVDMWWKSCVVYQIYPRSFMDSNADGIGDLNGIKNKLTYLQDLGVDAIWLSPIYKSPMYDFGYDIADYKSISPDYGTMADFDALMVEAKRLGIRVVLDYVPNHTSNESEWFTKSINKEGNYSDYYIWADGITNATGHKIPPSNWISQFRYSAWEFNEKRQQFYLHQFVVGQPDINYRNQNLRNEMKEVLRFWLNKGVSGFRIDAVNFLYEVEANADGTYRDEPRSNTTDDVNSYNYLLHPYSRDQNETYAVVYDWRAVLDEFGQNESKIMMTEAYTEMALMMRYYGDGTREGSIPFNFVFLEGLNDASTANDMKAVVDKWMSNMPANRTANWVNGNHDQSRMATRHGVNRVDAMNMLALILPGVTITYQGEELGMTNGNISWLDTKDPQACNTNDPVNYWKSSRDPARTPFHWDATANAGFSTANKTWLPVASNYQTVNVAAQKAATKSHYKFYKDVVALKHTAAVSTGSLATYNISSTVLVVTRIAAATGERPVIGILNLGSNATVVDLSSTPGVPENLEVVASGVDCTLNKDGVSQLSLGGLLSNPWTNPVDDLSLRPPISNWFRTVVQRSSITLPANCALVLRNSSTRFLVPGLLYIFVSLLHVWLK